MVLEVKTFFDKRHFVLFHFVSFCSVRIFHTRLQITFFDTLYDFRIVSDKSKLPERKKETNNGIRYYTLRHIRRV